LGEGNKRRERVGGREEPRKADAHSREKRGLSISVGETDPLCLAEGWQKKEQDHKKRFRGKVKGTRKKSFGGKRKYATTERCQGDQKKKVDG